MKTLQYVKSNSVRLGLIVVASLLINGNLLSQEVQSIFNTDTLTSFSWGIELTTASVQNEFGTQYGMYGGVIFYHCLMVGMAGTMNVTHPQVNYGYMGAMVKYIYKPNSIFHMSGQLTLGSGSARDYENPKSSTLDNFGNITGARFYFLEPRINSEINLGPKTKLTFGLGYRLINGINSSSTYISTSHVTDKDLSGATVNFGVEFGLR